MLAPWHTRPRTEESGVVSWRCDWNVGRLQFRLRNELSPRAWSRVSTAASAAGTDEFRDRGRGFNVLSLDVWPAQGWNGQFPRAIEQDADIEHVIPKEGLSLFPDSLVIPAGAPHPELAHAFIDFTLEAGIATEICATMAT